MSFLRRSVNDNFWRSSARKRHADAFQLELPLGMLSAGQPSDFLALPLDEMHGLAILESIRTLSPSIIIDMREFPRFDISGTSRRSIFNEIERAGAIYEQRPFPWSRVNTVNKSGRSHILYSYKKEVLKHPGRSVFFVSQAAHKEFLERELAD